MRDTFAKYLFARKWLLKQGILCSFCYCFVVVVSLWISNIWWKCLPSPRCKMPLFFSFWERLYNSKVIWLYYCKLNCHLCELLQMCNPKVKACLDYYVYMYLYTTLSVLILANTGWTVNLDISNPGTGTHSPPYGNSTYGVLRVCSVSLLMGFTFYLK